MNELTASIAIAHEQLTLAWDAAKRGDDYEAKLLVWGAKKALVYWLVDGGYSGVCGASRIYTPDHEPEPDFEWDADRVVDVPFDVTHWQPMPAPPSSGPKTRASAKDDVVSEP